MEALIGALEKHDIKYRDAFIRGELTTLQVNMGNLCNQSCRHCHVEASPFGRQIMPKDVIEDIIKFLSKNKVKVLDITGGAAELNPNFDFFIAHGRGLVEDVIVRSNLTVFFEPGKKYLPEFLKRHSIHLVCSLPCYTRENVDMQRGRGVFKKSIRALEMLNKLGYARDKNLLLDLAYNPQGGFLPPGQENLENDYRLRLGNDYGIAFNSLLTITNVPIKRFKEQLESEKELDRYIELLKGSFNPETVDNIMCRSFLNVGYDGRLYDCDFNQALGWALKNEKGDTLNISALNKECLIGREIMAGEHCLSCTAGSGSGCQGALIGHKDAGDGPFAGAGQDSLKEYYGKILKTNKDLKTSACCAGDSFPGYLKEIIKKIDREITDKFYGCGSPIPFELEGTRILDLGCGTGRDVYIASCLTGENGFVLGVDMTDEQLAVANSHIKSHMAKFGFSKDNVEFKKGYIEDLKEIGVADESVDVVISNCVINLSPDKEAAFSEILRVLKHGGELYFSDVFTDRRIPQALKSDPLLYGECLSGAMYIEDFRRLLMKLGCRDYRLLKKERISLKDSRIEKKAGNINFFSLTIRVFKIADLEDRCEDYGQIAVYRGTIKECPHKFVLDGHHIFIKNKPMAVCANTAAMLKQSRFGKHFKVIGDKTEHYGIFACSLNSGGNKDPLGGGCC